MWNSNCFALLLVVCSSSYTTTYSGVLMFEHGERDYPSNFKFHLETVSAFIPFPCLFTRVSSPLHSWDVNVEVSRGSSAS